MSGFTSIVLAWIKQPQKPLIIGNVGIAAAHSMPMGNVSGFC